MTQKQVLELVLQWTCDPDPKQGFAQSREHYEEQLQSIARLQATCKLDAPYVKLFMRHCWETMLGQYNILLKHLKENGDCTRQWWTHENARVADLRERGPRYALETLQRVARQYGDEQDFLFEAGGGVKAVADYKEYLAHQDESQHAWGGQRDYSPSDASSDESSQGASSDQSSRDSESDESSQGSDSDAGRGASFNHWWALEQARVRAWVEGLNTRRWTVTAMMLQKCPGLKPYSGMLREACKDHVTFERAWIRSWPWIKTWPPYWEPLLRPALR